MSGARRKSLDTAAKHLFRHLHDAKKLRVNLIARRVFELTSHRIERITDSELLLRVHSAVMASATRYRDAVRTVPNAERVNRQFEIVRLECLERRRIADIAAVLNISIKHCYRERAVIVQQIAQDLLQVSASVGAVTSGDEAFYYLLDRLCENDTVKPQLTLEAFRYLETISDAPHHRIAVIAARAALLDYCGNREQAEVECNRVKTIYASEYFNIPAPLLGLAGAELHATEWLNAKRTGDMIACSRSATAAARLVDEMPQTNMSYAQSLWVSAHYCLAAALWDAGELERGYEELAKAASRCDLPGVRKVIRMAVLTSIWKLRSYLVATRTSNYTCEMRLHGLKALCDDARRSGINALCAEALLSVTECHMFAGRDEEALRTSQHLLAVAGETGNRVFEAEMAIDAGVRLLGTRFWRQGLAQIGTYRGVENIGSYFRTLIEFASTVRDLRIGDFDKARRRAQSSVRGQVPSGMRLRFKLVEAESAYRSGRSDIAKEATSDAVTAAEQLGSAPILREAYTLATGVLDRRRFESRAIEMARLLAS